MKKLTVIAAALAAGMASFAHAKENVAQAPAVTGKGAKEKKAGKAEEKCQYLFSCNQIDAIGKKPGARVNTAVAEAPGDKAVKDSRKTKTANAKAAKNKVAKAKAAEHKVVENTAAKIKVAKAEVRKPRKDRTQITLKRDGKAVDLVTTAAIGGGGGKAIKAVVAGNGAYHAIIVRYAGEYGVPVPLAHAVINVESSYRPNITGSAGEIGLMQIKPATARMMGYSGSAKGLYNPETNIKFGMKYLSMAQKLGGGTTCGTILKYNAGHGAKRMNPVSSAYCSKVKRHLGV